MLETPLTTNLLPPPEKQRPPEGLKELAAKAPLPQVYSFSAHHLAPEGLKLKETAKLFDLKPAKLVPNRLVYDLGENGYCFFYNFGSVVFFNVAEAVRNSTLERLGTTAVTSDTFLLEERRRTKNAVFFDKVVVDKISREKIELMGLVLAQSVSLEFFENGVEDILNKLGQITAQLEKSGKPILSERKVRQFIGMAMAMKQKLIGTLSLLEKPDETWENKMLDDLHHEAVMMFELKERFRALDYKLKMIQENLELLSSFTTNRQLLILEAAIVGLFILDIGLVCYEIFLK